MEGTPEARWLDDQEMAAWRRFIAVVELLPGVLDSQLRRDSGLTHFEFLVLAALSDAPDHTLRMTTLGQRSNSTLTRLSHVVRRLEQRGLAERAPCPEDARATNAHLTDAGRELLRQAAPGHAETVRDHVIDPLTRRQIRELGEIAEAMLTRLDPEGRMTGFRDDDA